MKIYQDYARNGRFSEDDVDWVGSLRQQMNGTYIHSTVRRELTSGIPYEVSNITTAKIDEMNGALSGEKTRVLFDDVVAMYI
jgi:hypothetical protein